MWLFYDHGKPQGTLKDIVSNQCNFVKNPHFLHGSWELQTYPYFAAKIAIVTLKDEAKYAVRI